MKLLSDMASPLACLPWAQIPGYCCLTSCQQGWHHWCSWLLHWSCVSSMAAVSRCFQFLNKHCQCTSYYSSLTFGTAKFSRHQVPLALYLFICSYRSGYFIRCTCFIVTTSSDGWLKLASQTHQWLRCTLYTVCDGMTDLHNACASNKSAETVWCCVIHHFLGIIAINIFHTQWRFIPSTITESC